MAWCVPLETPIKGSDFRPFIVRGPIVREQVVQELGPNFYSWAEKSDSYFNKMENDWNVVNVSWR